MSSEYDIRLAVAADFSAIRSFYNQLIDDMLSWKHHPMWDKEGHPSDAYLQAALDAGQLWVACFAGEVVAALIVNHDANEGYFSTPWKVSAAAGEFSVVHAFGVSTRHQGRGLGTAMMQGVIERARAAGEKAVRLDVIDLNLPAARAYTRLGFYKCAEISLYYPEVGWQLFHMYEYAL